MNFNFKRRAFAMPLVMCTVVMLLILGIGLLSLGFQARLQAIRTTGEIASRCAADAGLTKALYEMNKKLDTKPWNDTSLPCEASISLPNSDLSYTYSVTKSGSNYNVSSSGVYGRAQKRVSCELQLAGVFDCPVFGDQSVLLYNSSTVDQYNTDANTPTLTVGTNSTGSGDLGVKNNGIIYGNAVVGVGGNPDVVVDNRGTITGAEYAQTELHTLEPVVVPAAINALPLKSKITDANTITASTKIAGIDLNTGKVLTIDGPVTLYVTGDIKLGTNAQIKVLGSNPNSSLTIYLGGNFISGNGSAINNETTDPHKNTIWGLDTCTSIELKNSGAFYGAIYAPKADVIYYNAADLYGSVISKSFETKNSAHIHYDASLRKVTTNDPLVSFTVKRWREN